MTVFFFSFSLFFGIALGVANERAEHETSRPRVPQRFSRPVDARLGHGRLTTGALAQDVHRRRRRTQLIPAHVHGSAANSEYRPPMDLNRIDDSSVCLYRNGGFDGSDCPHSIRTCIGAHRFDFTETIT